MMLSIRNSSQFQKSKLGWWAFLTASFLSDCVFIPPQPAMPASVLTAYDGFTLYVVGHVTTLWTRRFAALSIRLFRVTNHPLARPSNAIRHVGGRFKAAPGVDPGKSTISLIGIRCFHNRPCRPTLAASLQSNCVALAFSTGRETRTPMCRHTTGFDLFAPFTRRYMGHVSRGVYQFPPAPRLCQLHVLAWRTFTSTQ